MHKFIIAALVAGGAILGLGTTAQAAPVMPAAIAHADLSAITPALFTASPEAVVEQVQYGPRGDWRRRQEARRRAEWRRRQAARRGYYRR